MQLLNRKLAIQRIGPPHYAYTERILVVILLPLELSQTPSVIMLAFFMLFILIAVESNFSKQNILVKSEEQLQGSFFILLTHGRVSCTVARRVSTWKLSFRGACLNPTLRL